MATAGQMIAGPTPVTFCLTLNWHESEGKKDEVETGAYKDAVGGILGRVLKAAARSGGLSDDAQRQHPRLRSSWR